MYGQRNRFISIFTPPHRSPGTLDKYPTSPAHEDGEEGEAGAAAKLRRSEAGQASARFRPTGVQKVPRA